MLKSRTKIDSLFPPREQASFQYGRSAVDEVTFFFQKIKVRFLAKKKAGEVFADLTTAR